MCGGVSPSDIIGLDTLLNRFRLRQHFSAEIREKTEKSPAAINSE